MIFEIKTLADIEPAITHVYHRYEGLEEKIIALLEKDEQKANQPQNLTRKEVKEQYKISYGTIHNYMKSGELAFYKIGRKTLFKREDIERLFNEKRIAL